MKKFITLLITVCITQFVIAQRNTTKVKDSIKTEVVNIITAYAPKVTDAFKIKKKPVIELTNQTNKKKLDYKIVSVPVASKFTLKKGSLKGVEIGKKERIFDNYLAVGFGNNITPFFEGFMHNVTRFDSEYGVRASFNGAFGDPVKDTKLNSNFYNANLGLFYMQEERYFNWTAGVKAERNRYNWYALPKNIDYKTTTISSIDEKQAYNYYKVFGDLDFEDSRFKDAKAAIGYFSDIQNSNEFQVDIYSLMSIPIGRRGQDLDDIFLGFSFNFLGGNFAHGYNLENFNKKKHLFLTVGVNPYGTYNINKFDIKMGGKVYVSMDLQKQEPKLFVYPDINISYPIFSKFVNLYAGISGDLHQNSFKSFADENPYISPTIDILQTNVKQNFFTGLKGILDDKIDYNVKASYAFEDNKPLYTLHKSKSNDGIKTSLINGLPFFGYEYGNSFNVIYDNSKTIAISGEMTYDYSKNLTLGLSGKFNKYALKTKQPAWNLPSIRSDFFAKYKQHNWYASTTIFYVGDRKGIVYNGITAEAVDVKGYVDVNLNGGYNFNPLFSAFLKVNNATNKKYERFNNYNTQGIQIIGGFIYKFDRLF